MAENNSNSLESAILTTSLKSLKVLTQINEKQTEILQGYQALKDQADQNANQLDQVVKNSDTITKKFTELDIQKIIKTQMTQNEAMQNFLVEHIEILGNELSTEINKSNRQENISVMKKLVDGLRNMNENTLIVANRLEALANNVKGVSDDTNTLSETIIDNNARIISMDTRMGILLTDNELNDSMLNADDTLALLNKYVKPDDKVDVMEKLSRQLKNEDSKIVNDSEVSNSDHEESSANNTTNQSSIASNSNDDKSSAVSNSSNSNEEKTSLSVTDTNQSSITSKNVEVSSNSASSASIESNSSSQPSLSVEVFMPSNSDTTTRSTSEISASVSKGQLNDTTDVLDDIVNDFNALKSDETSSYDDQNRKG